jgi:hypothetical protein
MTRRDTKLESEGAEFLVLGRLLILGVPAYKAYANFPGYDLIATSADGRRAARIQVESRRATDAPHFLIRNFDCDFVVLVRLNRSSRSSAVEPSASQGEEPGYYVPTRDQAKSLLVDEGTGWDKIRWRPAQLERYRRKWDAIREFLTQPEPSDIQEADQHAL